MKNILKGIDFGNETADDADISELLPYFVEQEQFKEFVNPKTKLRIATAKKGMGKSALIQWAAFTLSNSDPECLVIKCRGADLSAIKTPMVGELNTPNDYIRNWMIRICSLVNRHLAARLKIALTDDSITLVEAAELEGFRSRNIVGCLIDRLNRLLPNSGGLNKMPAADEVALLRRAKKPRLWFLVDDLDATFQNTSRENIELGTFFSACRYLAQDLEDIYFRVTMRTDVWSLVRRFDESLDKVEQYVQEIVWPLADFRRLLYLRVKSHCDQSGLATPSGPYPNDAVMQEEVLNLVFVPKMTWGDREQFTYRVIYTLSYERPRWAIQLCKLARSSALQDGRERIYKENIDEVWGEFGAKRIKDLVAEHKHQCPQVEELLNAFRGCDRLLTRDELFAWVNNRVSTHLTPTIEGEPARSPRIIAHFLYRIGFILGRSENEEGEYEHYHFSEMPDFLSARTDEDFGISWEIHPCYREALDIKKLDRSHRRGFRRRRHVS